MAGVQRILRELGTNVYPLCLRLHQGVNYWGQSKYPVV